jgi:hypothetical protein
VEKVEGKEVVVRAVAKEERTHRAHTHTQPSAATTRARSSARLASSTHTRTPSS